MYREVGRKMKNCSICFPFTSYERTTTTLSSSGNKKSSERLQIVASFYSCSYLFASNLCAFYLSNISLFFCGRIFSRKHFCLHKSVFQLFSDVCLHNRCTDFSLREDNDHTHVSILCAFAS